MSDSKQVGGTHYKEMGIEPLEVLEALLTPDEFRGFLIGNIMRYAMRQGRKQGSDDAEKARHYIEMLKRVQTWS